MDKFWRASVYNEIKHKDRYCANFKVGENEIIVTLSDGIILVNREIYAKDRELAKFVYDFAGFNGTYNRVPNKIANFLLKIGFIKSEPTVLEMHFRKQFYGF